MRIVSKNLTNDKAKKFFMKKKNGMVRLRMTLDYYLLQKMYGVNAVSERINYILSDENAKGMNREALEEISLTLSDDSLSDKEKINMIIDLLEKI